jgi:hypothetical protein
MKSEKNSLNEVRRYDHRACALLTLLAALWLLALASGCTTVTPRTVTSPVASWDGTNQNSGFIGWTADGCGILTPHGRDRYNALVEIYGKKLAPAIMPDYGITATDGKSFIITPEALGKYREMHDWRMIEQAK